jgi:hypothetical protein
MHEKEVEIIMLRKDLENLKEHNERVWRGYENDVKDLRNQLGKKHVNSSDNQRNKNDELSSQLNITHTYKERSSTELQSAQEEIDRLSKKNKFILETKLMEIQNEHNDELRTFKEKLHKKESQNKELILEEEYLKSEHMKELKVNLIFSF